MPNTGDEPGELCGFHGGPPRPRTVAAEGADRIGGEQRPRPGQSLIRRRQGRGEERREAEEPVGGPVGRSSDLLLPQRRLPDALLGLLQNRGTLGHARSTMSSASTARAARRSSSATISGNDFRNG